VAGAATYARGAETIPTLRQAASRYSSQLAALMQPVLNLPTCCSLACHTSSSVKASCSCTGMHWHPHGCLQEQQPQLATCAALARHDHMLC
jgi:hypothetical protein